MNVFFNTNKFWLIIGLAFCSDTIKAMALKSIAAQQAIEPFIKESNDALSGVLSYPADVQELLDVTLKPTQGYYSNLQKIKTFTTNTYGLIRSAQYDFSGKWVILVCEDGKVRIENVANGENLFILDHGKFLHSAMINSNGNRVVTASSATLKIWELRNHTFDTIHTINYPDGENILRIAFSRDGNYIALIYRSVGLSAHVALRVLNVTIAERVIFNDFAHKINCYASIAFNLENTSLVVALFDRMFYILAIATGNVKEVLLLEELDGDDANIERSENIRSIRFSVENKYIIALSSQNVFVIDLENAKRISAMPLCNGVPIDIRFDGKYLATVRQEIVKLSKLKKNKRTNKISAVECFQFVSDSSIVSAQFSPDSNTILIATEKGVMLFGVKNSLRAKLLLAYLKELKHKHNEQ